MSVTLVTQTRLVEGQEDAFSRWQEGISAVIAGQPGFIDQKIIPPNPPAQTDWVILQRFSSNEEAARWLHSPERTKLLADVQPILFGLDDIHIVKDNEIGIPAPVSAIISTRIKPGMEKAYRHWEQRIAVVQSRAPGFQGYRFEPPIPGVQESWLSIVRFDSEDHLEAWLKSPERLKLLKDAEDFTENFSFRTVRSGFDQWFPAGAAGSAPAPVWKQNMVVLALLYPVVFLFGMYVQQPLIANRAGAPFWLALFIGNVVSVVLLNWLVPWTSSLLSWWLKPTSALTPRLNLLGVGVVCALYTLAFLVFSHL